MTYHKQKSTGNKGKKFSSNNSNKSNQKSNFKSKSSSNYKNDNNSEENRFSNNSNKNYNNRSSGRGNSSNLFGDNFQGKENKSTHHKFSRDNGKNFNNKPNEFKKVKPTAEENRQFAIKGNYKPGDRKRRQLENEFSNSKPKFESREKNFNSGSVRPGTNDNNSTKQILLDRYDKNFGPGTSRKLTDSIRMYSDNQFIRVNLSKMNIEEIQSFFKKNRVKFENTFLKNGFKIEKSFFNLSSSLPCLSGKIYFQDLASQVPVNCVDFEKLKSLNRKVKILDGCASPGSKTTQILDLLNFHKIEYELTAIELEENRVNRLINNIQKMGFSGFKIVNCSATDFTTSDKFDVIILDVPCSGNLVGDKNWLSKRNVNDICGKSDLQKSILKNISKYLVENGELIYSTCSIEVEENENNVKWISENCNLQSVKINLETGFDTSCVGNVIGLRFLPHKSKTQGFFVAKFVNKK
jgi:16S rRNA C967 or C1407 C5-methylase (RsmB/RsmF family)